MKKIIIGLLVLLAFLGCSSKTIEKEEPKLLIGKSLSNLTLNDQFKKVHKIDVTTEKIVLAFSKDMAHICNDFFKSKPSDYLNKNNTQFIADVSTVPSLIKSMFILPKLRDFEHVVLLLDNEDMATSYKIGIDIDKITIVYLKNRIITSIITTNSEDKLKEIIEN